LLIVILAAAANVCLAGEIERDPPYSPTECAYERLLSCYVEVMKSKGLDLDSPDRELSRYDRVARARCAKEIAAYKRRVGPAAAERDWNGLWDEYWSRL
jgi:hypothetical protein